MTSASHTANDPTLPTRLIDEVRRRVKETFGTMRGSTVHLPAGARKILAHGVPTIVPDNDVLDEHARQEIAWTIPNRRLDAIRCEVEATVAAAELPSEMRVQIEVGLREQPDIPWDLAVARVARKTIGNDSDTTEYDGGEL